MEKVDKIGGLIDPSQPMKNRIKELEERVEMLEKECRHFERQFAMLIHQISRDCNMLQAHELKLGRMPPDDHK